MENGIKAVLILAFLLVVIGGALFVLALGANDWKFDSNFETTEFEISDTFKGISINVDTADITFARSEDGKVKVKFYEHKNERHHITVQDEAINIGKNEKKWWENIFDFTSPCITVYLPEGEYGALKIESSTGDIEIPSSFKFESIDISLSTGDVEIEASALDAIKIKTSTGHIELDGVVASSIELSASTGEISLENVSCKGDIVTAVTTGDIEISDTVCVNFTSTGSTGKLDMKRTIASGKATIERSTGDVTFERSDASEFQITTDTGDVKGTLLTDKIFFAHTSSGKIQVPESMTGGAFRCETSTGKIIISIEP